MVLSVTFFKGPSYGPQFTERRQSFFCLLIISRESAKNAINRRAAGSFDKALNW